MLPNFMIITCGVYLAHKFLFLEFYICFCVYIGIFLIVIHCSRGNECIKPYNFGNLLSCCNLCLILKTAVFAYFLLLSVGQNNKEFKLPEKAGVTDYCSLHAW